MVKRKLPGPNEKMVRQGGSLVTVPRGTPTKLQKPKPRSAGLAERRRKSTNKMIKGAREAIFGKSKKK